MTEKLLPCPFCNSVVLTVGGFHVFCIRCGAEGPDGDDGDDATIAAAWNRRAAPEAAEPVARVIAEDEHETVDVGFVDWIGGRELKSGTLLYAAPTDSQAGRDALDAKRYRYLRDQHEGLAPQEFDAEGLPLPREVRALAFTVFYPERGSLEPVGCIEGELDATIDAALAAAGRGA